MQGTNDRWHGLVNVLTWAVMSSEADLFQLHVTFISQSPYKDGHFRLCNKVAGGVIILMGSVRRNTVCVFGCLSGSQRVLIGG